MPGRTAFGSKTSWHCKHLPYSSSSHPPPFPSVVLKSDGVILRLFTYYVNRLLEVLSKIHFSSYRDHSLLKEMRMICVSPRPFEQKAENPFPVPHGVRWKYEKKNAETIDINDLGVFPLELPIGLEPMTCSLRIIICAFFIFKNVEFPMVSSFVSFVFLVIIRRFLQF